MAAPVPAYIRLPDPSGNTGKNDREQFRTVGSDIVFEKELIRIRQAQQLGVYRAVSPQQLIVQTATNGTTTGLIWAHVPSAVTNKKVRLRRCFVTSSVVSTTARPTAPRLRMDRMTFTGTASGTQIPAVPLNSSYPSAVFDIRSAVTGLTVSLIAQLGNAALVGSITGASSWGPHVVDVFPAAPEEDEWIILAPGEGVVIYQDTAGTSGDDRVANVCFLWDEIDTA